MYIAHTDFSANYICTYNGNGQFETLFSKINLIKANNLPILRIFGSYQMRATVGATIQEVEKEGEQKN